MDLSTLDTTQARTWAEQFHQAAVAHEEADYLARQLESGKSVVFSEMTNNLIKEAAECEEKLSVAQAEREVYASEQYKRYLRKMHKARNFANLLKIEKERVKMLFSEWMCKNANARDEMRYST